MPGFKSLLLLSFLTLVAACTPGSPGGIMDPGGIVDKEELKSPVIEIVTLKLKDGVSYSDFESIDKAVEVEYVSRQPGFISREVAAGEDSEWLVIVHWETAENADASMATFMEAPAASRFIDNIDTTTMVMKRYSISN